MQEEVRDKSIAFVINMSKTGEKLTADVLKWTIQQYLKKSTVKHGKQTIKDIVKQGASIQNIEITDKNIKSFESVAKKYGVDYALKKDTFSQPPKYIVFFKARDAEVLMSALKEFSGKALSKERKPSIRKRIVQYQQKIKYMVKDSVKNRNKGGHEL
ncbi:MAG TPA: PcfB family protein [Candidatus Coprocola pullicola]|nr:PcfB family protein [Candidatus Coprocola pullicola]